MTKRTGYCSNCDMTNRESDGTELATEKDGKWICDACGKPLAIFPEELKKCPFCDGEGSMCNTNPHAFWIRCNDCGADAESGDSVGIGVHNWNRRIMTDSEKENHFNGYILGILHSIELVLNSYDEPNIAKEMRVNLLQGVPDEKLKLMCITENIQIDWEKLE